MDDTHFNPTRVRLKPTLAVAFKSSNKALQPHKGASETISSAVRVLLFSHFNPTRVRLKHVTNLLKENEDDTSTPQGCV